MRAAAHFGRDERGDHGDYSGGGEEDGPGCCTGWNGNWALNSQRRPNRWSPKMPDDARSKKFRLASWRSIRSRLPACSSSARSSLPLIVRHPACGRHRRSIARQIVRRSRQSVDPPGAIPQPICLELHDESTGAVGRDDNRRITGIYRLVAGSSDLEGTRSETRQRISSRHDTNLDQLVVRGLQRAASGGHTGDPGRGLVNLRWINHE